MSILGSLRSNKVAVNSVETDDLHRVMKKMCGFSYKERKAMGLAGRKCMEEIFDKRKVVAETVCYIKGNDSDD